MHAIWDTGSYDFVFVPGHHPRFETYTNPFPCHIANPCQGQQQLLTHTTASMCIMTSLLRLTMAQCTRKEVFAKVKTRMPMRSSDGDEWRGWMTGTRGMNDGEKQRGGQRWTTEMMQKSEESRGVSLMSACSAGDRGVQPPKCSFFKWSQNHFWVF